MLAKQTAKSKFALLTVAAAALISMTGCAAVERGGGFVLQQSGKAAAVVDAGAQEVNRQQREIATNKLQRTEDSIDFAQSYGKDIDDALTGALEDRIARMGNIAAFLCGFSAAERIPLGQTLAAPVLLCPSPEVSPGRDAYLRLQGERPDNPARLDN